MFTILIVIEDSQRVTLCAIQPKDDFPPVGLFFTPMEFDDLVSNLYPSQEYSFDPSFFNTVFMGPWQSRLFKLNNCLQNPKNSQLFLKCISDIFHPLSRKKDGQVDKRKNTQKWGCWSVSTATGCVHFAYCIWQVVPPPQTTRNINKCEIPLMQMIVDWCCRG